MTLGMQQGTLPVGSVSQALPMTGMPQTISMVQQIHPVSVLLNVYYIFLFNIIILFLKSKLYIKVNNIAFLN